MWRWTWVELSLVVGGAPLVPGQWTPPGLEVGCRRWCHGVVGGISLPSPPISGAIARCSHQQTVEPPTRWHTGTQHTATAAGAILSLVGLRPLPELRPTLYRGRSYCVVCVCVNRGRYHFHWTLFFLCSLLLPHASCSSHLFFSSFLPCPFLSPQSCSTQSPPNSSGPLEAGVQKRHRHFRCTAELRIHTCTPCPADRFGVDGARTHSGVFETVKQSKLGSVSPVARDLWPLSMAS